MINSNRGLRERIEFGQAQRRKLKRSDQSNWDPRKRKHDPLEIVRAVNRERIPELVPIKMARMSLSPFSFYRGSVQIMAADLASAPSTGIIVQICGDAHVRNLGAYAAPDGRLVFDINDFDETTRAPWEWDVKRLAASLILAGREAENSDAVCRDAVFACAGVYRKKMIEFSKMSCLQVARYRIHRGVLNTSCGTALERAERSTPLHTLEKLTVPSGKTRKFKLAKPVFTRPSKGRIKQVLIALRNYYPTLSSSSRHLLSFYRPTDVAFKIVGVGSVGCHDYVVLMFAGDGVADPLFLQIKEAFSPAYAAYIKSSQKFANQGERVIQGHRMLQFQSDILLGWTSLAGRDYLVRQLNDHKGSIENEDLHGAGLNEYATTCGEVLARGHARSGDPAVLSGYLGTNDRWDRALAKFAVLYAEQTSKDYEAFKKAIRAGKLPASKPYM